MPFPALTVSSRSVSSRSVSTTGLAFTVAAIAAVLVLSGCTASEAPAAVTSTPTVAASIAPTGDGTLLVGTLFPMTGEAGAVVTGAAQVAGTELAAREIQEQALPGTPPIQLVHRNSTGNVAVAVADLVARHVDLVLWDATTAVPAEVAASVAAAGIALLPLDGFTNGGTPLAADEAFAVRLRTSDPGLADTAGGGEAFDGVVLAALAATEAGDDAGPSLTPALDRVSRGDTVCTSWASCITALGEKKQIAYQGVTGRRS
ncbi:hypothetical protein KIV56_07930 [Cryobacterium breve]|uniref:Leucine-binding protein domain-containing protein n=1 Tax=Cryobacterium breve TaxID=1259258 RepID=A0ABY7NF46_9MICO|nr:hypothetical protein [Cryobacterium breve]WBM81137.1 hypothetical protein KIV56_07930 [Cryobacterium breve]